MTKIIIVNEQDEVVGYKERGTLLPEDIYRVSALNVLNSRGEILLAQRKWTKKKNPGKWGPAVAGTNDEGETYESNIIKEALEEIGLVDFEMRVMSKDRVNAGPSNYWGTRFETMVDCDVEDFKIQEEEVEQVKWFDKEELVKLIDENPEMFVGSIRKFL